MTEVLVQSRTPAGDFVGSEFSISPPGTRQRQMLRVLEVDLHLGAGPKTWRVVKVSQTGTVLLYQSLDANGAPGLSTDEAVVLAGADAGVLLTPGEQIQVITNNATNPSCRIYYEVTDLTVL